MKTQLYSIALLAVMLNYTSCEKMIDPQHNFSGYPNDIQKILVNKCAVSGCHNDASYQNAGGLNLSTYTRLFEGASNGAVAIPFSPTQSPLLQFVNSYPDLGLTAEPRMPLNAAALSREEVISLRDWIAGGCPDQAGNIPFSGDAATRSKIYMANQGCDLVSIVDAETQLVMRYVKVGRQDLIPEIPHCIRVSHDKRFWYVCFTDAPFLQKYDASGDTLQAEVDLPAGKWNILNISPDNTRAMLSDFSSNGKLCLVNLNTMQVEATYAGTGLFNWPHGVAFTRNRDTVYITAQYGNMIYRLVPALPQLDQVSLQPGQAPVTTPLLLDPHEIQMSPDYSRYFITCQHSNEVRVMRVGADTLLANIPVGSTPLEMAMSPKRNLLFVTCQEDPNPNFPGFKGSVYVINMNTLQVVKKLYDKFYQPHGISVDDSRGWLYVVSRNASVGGPAPHHSSECGGRNGYFDVIDLDTWQSIRGSSEISVDPYSADVR